MFRPTIVDIFRQVFFEGYITYNVTIIYKYEMFTDSYISTNALIYTIIYISLKYQY
jgi:hypothetical protein